MKAWKHVPIRQDTNKNKKDPKRYSNKDKKNRRKKTRKKEKQAHIVIARHFGLEQPDVPAYDHSLSQEFRSE